MGIQDCFSPTNLKGRGGHSGLFLTLQPKGQRWAFKTVSHQPNHGIGGHSRLFLTHQPRDQQHHWQSRAFKTTKRTNLSLILRQFVNMATASDNLTKYQGFCHTPKDNTNVFHSESKRRSFTYLASMRQTTICGQCHNVAAFVTRAQRCAIITW